MDENSAKLIFAGIMGLGFAVWLVSLFKAIRLGQGATPVDAETFDQLQSEAPDSQYGTLTLRGDPDDLAAKLAQTLAQGYGGMFAALFAIKKFDGGRVAMKKTGPVLCNQPTSLYYSDAEFSFERADHEKSKATYRLGYARLSRLTKRIVFGIILGIGLPVMLIVAGLIWFLVIPNNQPAVRWQVLQTLQIAHALWPPYLFLGIYSKGRRDSKTLVENVLQSLELME